MISQEKLHPTIDLNLEEIQKKPTKESFDSLILTSIKETLASLEETTKQKVLSRLENQRKIKIENIPSKINEFSEALEESFGKYGKIIEIKIMKNLYEKIAPFLYFPHEADLSFESYIETLRYMV